MSCLYLIDDNDKRDVIMVMGFAQIRRIQYQSMTIMLTASTDMGQHAIGQNRDVPSF